MHTLSKSYLKLRIIPNIEAMADPISKHYITKDLNGMFAIDNPLTPLPFGVTDCDKVLMFEVHQDAHIRVWSLQCKLLQDFIIFYTSPIGGPSIGLAQGRYEVGDKKILKGEPHNWNPPIDRNYGVGSYRHRLVLGSLLDSEGGSKELRGPKDADGDRDHPLTLDYVFTVISRLRRSDGSPH